MNNSRAVARMKTQNLYQAARDLRDELEIALGSAHPTLAHIDKACAELELASRAVGPK